MKLLEKLTIKNFKLNKKRTIVTIIGIMLSVALITAVTTIYNSAIASLIKFETSEKGNFHVEFCNVPINEINTLKNNRKISDVYLTQDVGYARLNDSKNEYKPYAFIKALTKTSLENLSIKLKEGRLPENENEVVIPTHLKTNGRITLNIGDTITLNIGKRICNNEELNQDSKYDENNQEEIVNTISKTYKIVGIIERPATNIEPYSAPGYTFITCMNDKNMTGNVNVYCRYTKDGTKDYMNVTAGILGINENALNKFMNLQFSTEEESNSIYEEMKKAKYQYNINQYLIDLETKPLTNNSVGGLGTVAAIICGIIVFASVFCIKNSFDISISEKTKQYGMLKSIGATRKQIKKNVFFEATMLGLIGIPLGLLLGIIASWILILVSNYFIGDMLTKGLNLIFSFSCIDFLISTTLGIITIYLSAIRVAKRASKISPIESIRNSGDIKINAKKVKSPRIIKRIFGVGGEISYKNLKRNKKKYRTTVISITVSTLVFIALSYFMSMAFSEVRNELKLKDYNLSLLVNAKNDSEAYKKVIETTKLDNIKEYAISKYDSIYITNAKYTSEYRNFMKDITTYDGYAEVRTINNEQYKQYLKKLGIDYEEAKDKAILISNNIMYYKSDEETGKTVKKELNTFDYNRNDTISCKNEDEKEFDIKVSTQTDILPFGISKGSSPIMILSEEVFEKYFSTSNITVFYDSDNPNKLQDDIDEVLSGFNNYNLNNVEENAKMLEKLYTLVGIFLYGFIIVITLIGTTNIFNTITTNMELRKPEFAMLKSIGMTTKEFNKMIRLETLFMGIKSLIISVPIGIGLSYLIYRALEPAQTIRFEIPINAIIIAIIFVFLLITCIMKYSMSKINKQNTIETIRNENI